MSDKIISNKRIAKNTLYLYFRSALIMLVSLYASRIVLNALGAQDYGIYNVVAGIISMVSFFNTSLAFAVQRYLNYEMRKGSINVLRSIFTISILGNCILSIIIVLLAETVGFWFIKTQLVIPVDRLQAAIWVYQCSIFTFVTVVLGTTYNAVIIAHEKMSIYAYISIIEVILNLFAALLLNELPVDKLQIYGILTLAVSVIIRGSYICICRKRFPECHFHWTWDITLFKNLFSFSGWMLLGTISSMLSTQGVNILMNIFFGPLYNAARAVAVQVNSAVNSLFYNFMLAVKPQIIKSYSQSDYFDTYQLIFRSSKYGMLLVFMFIAPLLLYTDIVLGLWLKNIPEFSILYTRLTIVNLLITVLFVPLSSVAEANGNMRKYQSAVSITFLLIFIITYICYLFNLPSYTTFIVSILISLLGLVIRLYILKHTFKFPAKQYVSVVIYPIIKVSGISFMILYLIYLYIPKNIISFFLLLLFSLISVSILAYQTACNKEEKKMIKKYLNL